jgi:hypothetical protein
MGRPFVYVRAGSRPDPVRGGPYPARPGPAPACTDAELLAIVQVRHLPGRRSVAGFPGEVARDWGHLLPVLPCQGKANRRIRWLREASEQLRAVLATRLPEDEASRRTRPHCR